MTDAEKMCEIKMQNEKLEMLSAVAKILYAEWGDEPPCNFNDNDSYMICRCGDYCDKNCGNENFEKCWQEWLKAKLKEQQVNIPNEPIEIEDDLH